MVKAVQSTSKMVLRDPFKWASTQCLGTRDVECVKVSVWECARQHAHTHTHKKKPEHLNICEWILSNVIITHVSSRAQREGGRNYGINVGVRRVTMSHGRAIMGHNNAHTDLSIWQHFTVLKATLQLSFSTPDLNLVILTTELRESEIN